MTDEATDAVDLLGEPWTRFRRICDEWLGSQPPSEDWEASLPPSERLCMHVGAFLHAPGSRDLQPWTYETTPRQSCAFASTGGDGEHFSVMLDPLCRGVIVVSAPMAFDRPNVVVGESFVDFLGLVVVSGFGSIPSVAYDGFEPGSAAIVDATAAQPASLLTALRDGLGVEPWTNIAARLQELADAHLGQLRLTRS